ncbi:hypothetical protein [Streptosporangium sp. NPDC048865]|uniref:hypothetical protein n=1 Tax=Streptosporangium sp. NPDC048865 TaxID=3155766 RepID=UPI003433EB00
MNAPTVVIHHIPRHAGWPNGEQPSGWPGTVPGATTRDAYDQEQAQKGGTR